MPDFWLDTDSFLTPSNGPYRFGTLPRFWTFLQDQAEAGVIASSQVVFRELLETKDMVADWAKNQRDLFWEADIDVQVTFTKIADNVNNTERYYDHHKYKFLDGADPWIIAHAKTLGGKVVTFEKSEPQSARPKIPDVCNEFGVKCINVYDMITEMGVQL